MELMIAAEGHVDGTERAVVGKLTQEIHPVSASLEERQKDLAGAGALISAVWVKLWKRTLNAEQMADCCRKS